MKRSICVLAVLALGSAGIAACVAPDAPAETGEGGETTGEGGAALGSGRGTERYIVVLHDYGARGSVLSAAGAQPALELPRQRAVAAYMPAAAARGLARHPAVESVEIDPRRYPAAQAVPYGVPMVQASDPVFSGAQGTIRVCVVDSGLYTGHPDLQGVPITGQEGTAWNQDGCGHGTHVAGTIAAADDGAGVVGVAPHAVSIHVVRVFGDDCSWSYASNLVAALDECQDAGARIVSMSLAGSGASVTENNAFKKAYASGVLPIAAAGNGGNTAISYPAGYSSVMSVAAVDQKKALAPFSQRNSDVEIAAPGVRVWSTVPWSTPTVTAGGETWDGGLLQYSVQAQASGELVDGGHCTSTGPWSGKVVLCKLGWVGLLGKVENVQDSGGVAALVYNDVPGGFVGSLGAGNATSIPAVALALEDGQALLNGHLGQPAWVDTLRTKPGAGYESWSGTSMAVPHVTGVAALIWSFDPSWTNAQIRSALTATAQDLGAPGKDTSFGHGLVQAKAALDYLVQP